MSLKLNALSLLTASLVLLALVACSKPGPAEEAGKKIDKAAVQIEDTLKRKEDKAEIFMKDSEITARVKTTLLRSDGLPTAKITVKTQEGVVTLTGSINSQAHYDLVQKLTEGVEGVRHIDNKLVVIQ
jgi:hyperosmotically inducible protein